MKSIFEYTDYRQYLRDLLAEKKSQDSTWTHRMVCASLGLRTSNFMLLVIQGKRNISSDIASRVSALFQHSAHEAEFFASLVLFNQAGSTLEKDYYWKNMLTARTRQSTNPLSASQYEYYSHWYNPVIRELVSLPGMEWDTRSLSKALKPRVPAVQVRHSLELLESLGIIRKEGDSWVKSASSVATPPEVQSVAIFNYHRELIDLARESLENDPGTLRNFTTLTLEMNAQEYQLIVDMLTTFRRQALGVCTSTGPADRVYQLNLQLFPVSQTVETVSMSTDSADSATSEESL